MRSIMYLGHRYLTVLLTCVALVLGGSAAAQTITSSGKVVDANGEPVIGASVIQKGSTTNGVITDVDGAFKLVVPSGSTIEISCIGYVTVDVAAAANLVVTLEEDTTLLEETVVVGYGTMKKTDVTGAMVSVTSESLTSNPVTNAVEALQGKAAGVYVSNNGRPGSAGSITIRGTNSISASSSPLIVIDGIISRSVGLDMINPQDIESIEILKDASATAIYGAQGGNGVVLVSTNRGKKGKVSVNYSGTVTAEKIFDVLPMMDIAQTMEWRRWAYYYAGLTDIPGNQPNLDVDRAHINIKGVGEAAWANILKGWGLTYEQWQNGATSTNWDPSKVTSTDWTKYSDRVGITHEHTISASGGTDKVNAYVSFGYLNNQGTTQGQGFQRYTMRASADITPKDWFKMGSSINLRYSDQAYGVDGSGGASNSLPGSLRARALTLFPYGVPYDENGERLLYPDGHELNVTVVDEVGKVAISNLSYDISASLYAEFNFGEMWAPLKGLTFKSNFGPQLRFGQNYKYMSKDSANRMQVGKDYVGSGASKNFSWTIDNMLYYNRTFGKHSVDVTLLHEAMYNMSTQLYSMNGTDIQLGLVGMEMTQLWWGLNGSTYTREGEPSFNSLSEAQMVSYMGRVNYGFNNRYLLTLSYRYDGASQLGPGHKWQGFPSVALGWRLDQEDFMKDIDWIENLKLRTGWGKTGNYSVGRYSTKDNLSSSIINFGAQGETVYYTPNSFANQEISWEVTDQYNIGVDFSVLKGRISGVVDVYHNRTNGLIFDVKLPSASGKTSTKDNIGKLHNNGIDITLNTINISRKDFSWRSTLNLDFNKNKIIELQDGKNDMVGNGWFIGQPLSVAYTYKSLGLWTDSPEDLAEMAKFNANGHNFEPGFTRVEDLNGDYKIDANNDRQILGNSTPLWNLGFTNTFRYKNWQLDIFMFGRLGYFTQTGYAQATYAPARVMDYYTEDNKDAVFGKPVWHRESNADAYNGNLIQINNGFIKVRQISIGYNFPEKMLKPIGLKSVRVNAQLKNPFSVYDGAWWTDSDAGQSVNRGLVFGVNIGF